MIGRQRQDFIPRWGSYRFKGLDECQFQVFLRGIRKYRCHHVEDLLVAKNLDGLGGGRVGKRTGSPLQFRHGNMIGMLVREEQGSQMSQGSARPLHLEKGIGAKIDFEIVIDERP